jgi:purine-nucleoside phosphorylase
MISLREQCEVAAEYMRESLPAWDAPAVFIQSGSGLAVASILDDVLGEVDVTRLPYMHGMKSPAGHPLRLQLGACAGKQILVCQGRRHLYEGAGVAACVLPACAAALNGVRNHAYICAAGAVNSEYRPGTIMVMADYINNLGASPLTGPSPLGETFFPAMNEAFSQELLSGFVNAASEVGLQPRLGVFQANHGAEYETPAEVEVARRNGVDAVGMSVVLEAIAARALDCRVLGLAVIANPAAASGAKPPSHQDVLDVGKSFSPSLVRALKQWIADYDCSY